MFDLILKELKAEYLTDCVCRSLSKPFRKIDHVRCCQRSVLVTGSTHSSKFSQAADFAWSCEAYLYLENGALGKNRTCGLRQSAIFPEAAQSGLHFLKGGAPTLFDIGGNILWASAKSGAQNALLGQPECFRCRTGHGWSLCLPHVSPKPWCGFASGS